MPKGYVPVERQCTAKSKQSGVKCKRRVSPGNEKCYIHGGATLKGMASPNFKTGKSSKVLPQRLLERYHEALSDEELLELNDEIALVDARVNDLIARVESGESGGLLRELSSMCHALIRAQRRNDSRGQSVHLNEIIARVTRAQEDYAAWDDVERWIKTGMRLRESERKRLLEKQQMITTEEVLTLVTALTDSVRRQVTQLVAAPDTQREVLRAIQTDFGKLLHTSSRPSVSEPSHN